MFLNDRKQEKYDRQLRLWKQHGQLLLEESKICLLNATSVGSEILKNLILPSIGSFTVIDDAITNEIDLGNNFYVSNECIGISRAEAVCTLLNELNEDVRGYFKVKNVQSLIESDLNALNEYDLIIVTAVFRAELLSKLNAYCIGRRKPLVICNCVGFLGYMRIWSPEVDIIESHPSNIVDLRLDSPWPELERFCDLFDLNSMDGLSLSHTPFVVVLLKCSKEWRSANGGKLPQTYEEKNQFKSMITKYASAGTDSENFNEAVSQAFRVWSDTTVPSSIKTLLEDEQCNNVSNTNDFWCLMKALKAFILNEGKGKLPLIGSIPDMKADTTSYVKLQTIYKDKFTQDKKIFKKYLQEFDASLKIQDDVVDLFCRNVLGLKVVRYRSLSQELNEQKSAMIQNELSDLENREIRWYLVYIAIQDYQEKFGTLPGPDSYEELKKLLKYDGLQDYAKELCRFQGSELINISSFMGGVASQECIKLITKQYVPLNNTLIFDGMKSSTRVFQL